MPTTHPRLTVTLSTSTSVVLDALSAATGQSKSSIIAELVDAAVPVFERVTRAVLAVDTIKQDRIASMVKGLERGQKQAEKALGVLLDDLDETTIPLFEEVERVARRSRKRPAPDAPRSGAPGVAAKGSKRLTTPVPVTRGSGIAQKRPRRS
jgi:predicted DNA-binding protein